jgi:hypothetical protein
MIINFYFVNLKKDKKSYIVITNKETNVNELLYNKLYNIPVTNSINYYEFFYIKKGMQILWDQNIWDELVKIYLSKLDLLYLIDQEYILNIYSNEMILFSLDEYETQIKQFIMNYYDKLKLNNS